MVARNLRGQVLEKRGQLEEAIALYEANVRAGFDGNCPYDRLAVIYRKQKRYDDEIRVLQRGIGVLEALPGTRGDEQPKLLRFRERLAKAQILKAQAKNGH